MNAFKTKRQLVTLLRVYIAVCAWYVINRIPYCPMIKTTSSLLLFTRETPSRLTRPADKMLALSLYSI